MELSGLGEETARRRNHSDEGGTEEGNLKSPDCLVVTGELSRPKNSVSRIKVIYTSLKQSEDIKYKHMIVSKRVITLRLAEWSLPTIR